MNTPLSTPHRRQGAVAVAVVAAVAAAVVLAVLTPRVATAMSGGQPVLDDQTAPWVATLARTGDGPLLRRAGCGGVLVAPDRVLTAAHCVAGGDPASAEVHLGARVLSQDPGQVRGIRQIAVLPGYSLLPSPADPSDPNLSSARNDLAVVVLDSPVTSIEPVAVAERRLPGTRRAKGSDLAWFVWARMTLSIQWHAVAVGCLTKCLAGV